MKTLKNIILSVAGAFIMAFGLYEIHSFSSVTEGGVLGLTLLIENSFNISPALSSFILNALCYLFGFKILGKKFIFYSGISTLVFSLTYRLLEGTSPIVNLEPYPLIAAVVGAIFIGVGAGLSVRAGGAPSGDDALAMALSKLLKTKIEVIYLFTDLAVLVLSLSYIPLKRIAYSLLSVILSGKIVGLIERKK